MGPLIVCKSLFPFYAGLWKEKLWKLANEAFKRYGTIIELWEGVGLDTNK